MQEREHLGHHDQDRDHETHDKKWTREPWPPIEPAEKEDRSIGHE